MMFADTPTPPRDFFKMAIVFPSRKSGN
jgi:hypothetical protein